MALHLNIIRPLALVACAGLAVTACDTVSEDNPLAKLPRALTTYNVGLATGYVDYAKERLPAIIALVQTFDTDVLCLNEVWTEADTLAIIEGVKATYPYSHYELTSDTTVGPPACTAADTANLLTCVETNCADVASSEITNCVLSKCGAEFGALPDACAGCLATNIGKEIPEIISICQTGGPKYTYGGANGLLVLSRVEITNPQHKLLDSSLVQRSVLGVTVDLPLIGKTAIGCTHLAADLSPDVPYIGTYGTYAAENKAQAEVVRDFVATYGASANLRVMMGDMNSGPGFGTDLKPEIPTAAYAVMRDAGYAVFPSATGDAGMFCTFCASNLLNADDIPNVQLDQIALSVMPAGFSPSVTRVATDAITVTRADGSTVNTHPSDHFGVRLRLVR